MASVRNNGGGCCGAYHIAGFSDGDAADVRSLENCLARIPSGRLTEIILNQTQMNGKPLLLAKMAEVGFVLTDSWINNNHGSRLYRFSLCDRRNRVDEVGGRANWPGQVIQPSMRGDYAALRDNPRAVAQRQYDQAMAIWRNWRPPAPVNGLRYGARVTVNSPRSRRNRQTFTVVGFEHNYYGERKVVMVDNGVRFSISQSNVVLNNAVPAPIPQRPPEPVRPAILDEPVTVEPRLHTVG
jgi:hypothetical protein